ncbi:MAG TPA: methyltransferase [Actinocrinis sp.]|nr:methyltransferase [Actinocrinis sp.]
MLDDTDLARLDRAVQHVQHLADADALALVAGPRAAVDRSLSAAFCHVGILVFPDRAEDVAEYLRNRGMAVHTPIPSVVVRQRLAARYAVAPERLPVDIITGEMPDGRCLEVFVLPGLADRAAPDGMAELERRGQTESHFAFELPGADRDRVDALRAALAEDHGLVPGGGGYNPDEDAAAGGRSVFYFEAAPGARADRAARAGNPDQADQPGGAADVHRIELACAGEYQESLAEHRRLTDAVADGHRERLFELVTAQWVARAVQAAAQIGLPDALRGGGRTAEEVADALGCDRPAVTRLLRFLAARDIVVEGPAGRYSNGPVSTLLQRENPFSDLAILYGEEIHAGWSEFDHSVRTGQTGFRLHFGEEHFEYLKTRPELRLRFDRAMAATATALAERVCTAYDFSQAASVVDIGGGNGTLLQGILQTNDRIHATLFDLAEATEAVAAQHQGDERFSTVSGSFFEQVPEGADVYLLARVLHDWPDEQCAQILAVTRKSMSSGSRLLIIERVLDDGNAPTTAGLWDLHMLAITSGRERTRAEYRRLLADADLDLVELRNLCLGFSMVVAAAH